MEKEEKKAGMNDSSEDMGSMNSTVSSPARLRRSASLIRDIIPNRCSIFSVRHALLDMYVLMA